MANNTNKQDVLKALLDAEDTLQEDVFMARFGVDFTIQAIDGKMLNRIQDECTFERKLKGGKREKSLDEQKFQALIIEKACVVPVWNDQALKDKYGVFEAYEVVQKRLLAGELVFLAERITQLSGFGDQEEKIDEIKEP